MGDNTLDHIRFKQGYWDFSGDINNLLIGERKIRRGGDRKKKMRRRRRGMQENKLIDCIVLSIRLGSSEDIKIWEELHVL